MSDQKPTVADEGVIRYLKDSLTALVRAGIDSGFADSLRSIIGAAEAKEPDRSTRKRTARERRPAQLKVQPFGGIANLRDVSTDDLGELLRNPEVPRAELERVALDRFGLSAGTTKSFRSKSALLNKLRLLIENENIHISIARLASGEPQMINAATGSMGDQDNPQ